MKRRAALILLIAVVVAPLQAQSATDDAVFRNIRQSIIKGDKTERRDVTVSIGGAALVVSPRTGDALTIPYDSITSMTYDRRSKMRKMAPTYGKAQDHFLTVQYKSASGVGEFLEIEMEKDVAPRLIATLEARSGKKIERVVAS